MTESAKNNFKEKISPFLAELMASLRTNEGENSPSYRALSNQYCYSPKEEVLIESESNTKHYEASVEGVYDLPKGVERLYKRQIVVELTLVCAAHCRYCLRSNYERFQISKNDINKIVNYCSSDKDLKEILITGGDPFLVPQLLQYFISEIALKARNIQVIRIGTRLPVHDPSKFNNQMYSFFNSYRKELGFEVAIQINHPVELQPESRNVIKNLIDSGVKIYSQNVLLKDINDDVNTLAELYDELRYLGVEAHYLFHPVPIRGTGHFRIPITEALVLIGKLTSSGVISGRIKPMLSLMTDVGKVTLYEGTLGTKDTEGYYTVNTFYRLEDRLKWNQGYKLPSSAYVNEQGYIIVKYKDGNA